jgi:hypothetical protein
MSTKMNEEEWDHTLMVFRAFLPPVGGKQRMIACCL